MSKNNPAHLQIPGASERKLLREMSEKIEFLYDRAKDHDRQMKEFVDKMEEEKKDVS